jgi:hypothetical protein
MKDRRNAFLQESQQLIENLFHERGSGVSTALIDPRVTWNRGGEFRQELVTRKCADDRFRRAARVSGGRGP